VSEKGGDDTEEAMDTTEGVSASAVAEKKA